MPGPKSILLRLMHLALVFALTVLSSACEGDSRFQSPTAPIAGSPAPVDRPAAPGLPPTSEVSTPGLYSRVTPHQVTSLNFHGGSLEERYVFEQDGEFRLQFESARYGDFEYLGHATRSGDLLYQLNFEADPRWTALAGFVGNCLIVDYDEVMDLSDFEDAEYCR